ncbi:MAG: hypothetical protein ACOCWG_00695, partial [bacterium]
MNILWIEDNPEIDQLKKQLFLENKKFDSKINKIITATSFDHAFQLAQTAYKNIDLIVLDINLEHFDIGDIGNNLKDSFQDLTSDNAFLQESGFHIYLELLKVGFPDANIVFLTGNTDTRKITSLWKQYQNAYIHKNSDRLKNILDTFHTLLNEKEYNQLIDAVETGDLNRLEKYWLELANQYERNDKQNTYPKYLERFQAARLPLPLDIHKDNIEEFHDWISDRVVKNENSPIDIDYFYLRRGIIEACEYLQKELNNKSENFILFNKTSEKKLDKNYIKDYLTKLENFLPLNPPNNRKPLYYQFLKELSSDWEMSKGRFNRDFCINDQEEKNFKKTCHNQLKFLRNWTSHYQLTSELSEKEVAFFFMLAMRAWFDLDYSEILDYENILAQVFDSSEIKTIENNLAKSYQNLRYQLGDDNPYRNRFSDLMISLTKKSGNYRTLQKDSKKLFYQNYWHGLYPARFKIAPARSDKDSVAMFVNF